MTEFLQQRARSAFAIVLEAMARRQSRLRADKDIRTLTRQLVEKVEAIAEPEDWPVTEYTDDFREYHPEDSAIWERFFFHAMFVSTDLADCLCFLRAGGAILVPDAAYGYIIRPVIGGHGYRSQDDYDRMKQPLRKWQPDIVRILRLLHHEQRRYARYEEGRLEL